MYFVPRFLVALVVAACFTATSASAGRVEGPYQIRSLEQGEPIQRPETTRATPCANGMASIYPCDRIDLMAVLPVSSLDGGKECSDLWGWTDPITAREYAIVGCNSGTSFVDLTDARNPVYLGKLPPHGKNADHRDIKVYANHAYIVSEASDSGVQVFDLTQLRDLTSPPVAFSETGHYAGIGNAHNIQINEAIGFAYVLGTTTCSGGPHFLDLAEPTVPVFAGCHIEKRYTHDAHCVVYAGPDPDHAGRNICINSSMQQISVIDVTDHSAPSVISEITYEGRGYVHQGWLTEDHRHFLLDDEYDEINLGHNTLTRIFDMTDLDAPTMIGIHEHASKAIDHDQYTHQGYVYQANLRAGLRILDLAEVASGKLTEVGFFDVYPSSDATRINGAWGVYPYYASGHVAVGTIEGGLFILRPDLAPRFELDIAPARAGICNRGDDTADVRIVARNGYTGSVALSAGELPAGVNVSLAADPIEVPGNRTLTIGASRKARGTHAIGVTADDGAMRHEEVLFLELARRVPGRPKTSSPSNAAVNVARAPALAWKAAREATGYSIEIATDAAFRDVVYTAKTSTTTHASRGSLEPRKKYYWRVRATNPCGSGSDSAVASFTTRDVPEILLIDDDDNNPDVRDAYTSALVALDRRFDIWDTNNTDDEPDEGALGPYKSVIWFTGAEHGGAAGPGISAEPALASWLDSSRCLLISSQDYFYDHGLTDFMKSHLGLSSVEIDIGQTRVYGVGAYEGLGPYDLSFPFTNWTDGMVPGEDGQEVFRANRGAIGIEKNGGVYRTSFWGFGLEVLPTMADRKEALGLFLGRCDALDAGN